MAPCIRTLKSGRSSDTWCAVLARSHTTGRPLCVVIKDARHEGFRVRNSSSRRLVLKPDGEQTIPLTERHGDVVGRQSGLERWGDCLINQGWMDGVGVDAGRDRHERVSVEGIHHASRRMIQQARLRDQRCVDREQFKVRFHSRSRRPEVLIQDSPLLRVQFYAPSEVKVHIHLEMKPPTGCVPLVPSRQAISQQLRGLPCFFQRGECGHGVVEQHPYPGAQAQPPAFVNEPQQGATGCGGNEFLLRKVPRLAQQMGDAFIQRSTRSSASPRLKCRMRPDRLRHRPGHSTTPSISFKEPLAVRVTPVPRVDH